MRGNHCAGCHRRAREKAMWARYKKSFASMQLLIAVVTLGALLLSQRVILAGSFLVTMQLGAILGAAWAARLERLLLARAGRASERRG
jgi:uncharacterized membrane protein YesL